MIWWWPAEHDLGCAVTLCEEQEAHTSRPHFLQWCLLLVKLQALVHMVQVSDASSGIQLSGTLMFYWILPSMILLLSSKLLSNNLYLWTNSQKASLRTITKETAKTTFHYLLSFPLLFMELGTEGLELSSRSFEVAIACSVFLSYYVLLLHTE